MEGTRHPGYPFGLMGDEIPLGARIIAVVDAFLDVIAERPWAREESWN